MSNVIVVSENTITDFENKVDEMIGKGFMIIRESFEVYTTGYEDSYLTHYVILMARFMKPMKPMITLSQ